MAQVKITVGGVDIQIEDEDRGFKPVLKGAFDMLLKVIDKIQVVDDDEEDDHG
jgi:hypothetical protein